MTPAQFLARIKRNEIPPIALFLGPEAYDLRRCRDALAVAMPDAETVPYDLGQATLAEAIDDARSMSLFAAQRVIVLSNAEAALPKTDSGESGSETLSLYAKDPTPGVVLLIEVVRLDFERDDKRKIERVRKFFAAAPDVVELKRHSPDEARQEAQAMLRRAEVSIEPSVVEMLVESLGADLSRISGEVEKLALFGKKGSLITPDDIAALIPDARETNIFALVSALGRRDRLRALGVLDTLCRDGEYLPLALSFLSTQFRMALMAKEAGLRTSQQVQGQFNVWGSRADQVVQTMSKFSKEHLERGMKLIFETDRALRDSRPDDRIVMERFVVELTAA